MISGGVNCTIQSIAAPTARSEAALQPIERRERVAPEGRARDRRRTHEGGLPDIVTCVTSAERDFRYKFSDLDS